MRFPLLTSFVVLAGLALSSNANAEWVQVYVNQPDWCNSNFSDWDTNGDGYITSLEAPWDMSSFYFDYYDENNSGNLDPGEFGDFLNEEHYLCYMESEWQWVD